MYFDKSTKGVPGMSMSFGISVTSAAMSFHAHSRRSGVYIAMPIGIALNTSDKIAAGISGIVDIFVIGSGDLELF